MWKLVLGAWGRQEAKGGGKRLLTVKIRLLHTHLMPLLSETAGSFLCDSAIVRDGSVVDRCRD